jgi:hypothetical protein
MSLIILPELGNICGVFPTHPPKKMARHSILGCLLRLPPFLTFYFNVTDAHLDPTVDASLMYLYVLHEVQVVLGLSNVERRVVLDIKVPMLGIKYTVDLN